MALFNRNKTDQAGMPKEVQDYYQAENRERTGMAWLLALGTLLITVVIVLGLFYGGRWTFRKFKNNDKSAPVAVQTDETTDDASKTETEPGPEPTPQTSSASTSEPSSTTQTNSSNQTSNGSTTTSTTAPSTTSSVTNSNLPNTGPGDTLAVFAAVSALAYFAHRKFLARI